MAGFEYGTAIHMIYEGQAENGVKVFEAIRDRFDGKKTKAIYLAIGNPGRLSF